MRLDELKWRPREKEHHFDIAEVKRADGKHIVIERYPENYDYCAFFVQSVPYDWAGGTITWPLERESIEVSDILAAQAVLIELLQEVTCDSTS